MTNEEEHKKGVGHERKSEMEPDEINEVENKKKAEAKISTFTLNEDQQRCYSIKIKSVGASFANAIFRWTTYIHILLKIIETNQLDEFVELTQA